MNGAGAGAGPDAAGSIGTHRQRVVIGQPVRGREMNAPAIAQPIQPAAQSARVVPQVGQALEVIREAAPEDVIFITGSLYLVGEARPLLKEMGLLA